MDRHIGRTIVRNSAGDARVIWSIFSGYHPQGLRESGEDLQIFIFSGTVCSIHRSRCENVGNNSVIFGWIAFRSVS